MTVDRGDHGPHDHVPHGQAPTTERNGAVRALWLVVGIAFAIVKVEAYADLLHHGRVSVGVLFAIVAAIAFRHGRIISAAFAAAITIGLLSGLRPLWLRPALAAAALAVLVVAAYFVGVVLNARERRAEGFPSGVPPRRPSREPA